jgi:hypothetical protein
VIKISRTSDNTNKKLYISICKAEERIKNRESFEKEFFEIINNKFKTDKNIPTELLLVYEPYDDKLDVISIYEDHLYVKEGIFITKFDKEELLLHNIFNITLSEENLNTIFIDLKMKCVNHEKHKNTIKEAYYLGDINYRNIFPYELNDDFFKLLLCLKANYEDDIQNFFKILDFEASGNGSTSFLYILEYLHQTEVFKNLNMDLIFLDKYIDFIIKEKDKKYLLRFITVFATVFSNKKVIKVVFDKWIKTEDLDFWKQNFKITSLVYHSELKDPLIYFKNSMVNRIIYTNEWVYKSECFLSNYQRFLYDLFSYKKPIKILWFKIENDVNKTNGKIIKSILNS